MRVWALGYRKQGLWKRSVSVSISLYRGFPYHKMGPTPLPAMGQRLLHMCRLGLMGFQEGATPFDARVHSPAMLKSAPHSDDGHSMDHGARLEHLGAVLKYRVITVVGNQVLFPLGFYHGWFSLVTHYSGLPGSTGLDRT